VGGKKYREQDRNGQNGENAKGLAHGNDAEEKQFHSAFRQI
jgi:hypothetical protein